MLFYHLNGACFILDCVEKKQQQKHDKTNKQTKITPNGISGAMSILTLCRRVSENKFGSILKLKITHCEIALSHILRSIYAIFSLYFCRSHLKTLLNALASMIGSEIIHQTVYSVHYS